jgi:uncharacterized membrane protein (UPF0127 family)
MPKKELRPEENDIIRHKSICAIIIKVKKLILEIFLFPSLIMFGLILAGCFSTAAQAPGRSVQVFFPDGAAVTAELAVTDAERQLGLMFRPKINDDQAMLFIFEEEGIHSFWMKNMRFSIDILWLDKDRRIVHMEEQVPACAQDPCPSYPTSQPARFVLEIRSGGAAAHKLKLYDRLDFILPRDLRPDKL